MPEHLVGLCVGHSRSGDRGATSVSGQTEHAYNSELVRLVQQDLASHGVKSVIVDKYEGSDYGPAMTWLSRNLRERGVTVAVEFHFNAADSTKARGHEFLYWSTSKNGRDLATSLEKAFLSQISTTSLPSRGTKPKTSADRGAGFLQKTFCPACIGEPFFGTNINDWDFATKNKAVIASAYAKGIADWVYSH